MGYYVLKQRFLQHWHACCLGRPASPGASKPQREQPHPFTPVYTSASLRARGDVAEAAKPDLIGCCSFHLAFCSPPGTINSCFFFFPLETKSSHLPFSFSESDCLKSSWTLSGGENQSPDPSAARPQRTVERGESPGRCQHLV